MATNADLIVAPVVQQSFLGASITNFSINIGFNSNSSSLNLSLVEDEFFTTGKIPFVNFGVLRGSSVYEGYHNWDHTAHPYLVTPAGNHHDDCRQLQVGGTNSLATFGDRFCPPTPGEPVYFKYYDSAGALVFSYNGIVNRYERNQGTSGTHYSVSINDPRMILEGSQLILDKYMGTTAPADASHGLVTSPFLRNYNNGWLGYYNIINVFGYYEGGFNYGAASKNESGMPWLKVLDAMHIMLTSNAIPNTTLTGYMINEPYGGPLYYLPKSAPGAPMSTYPVNAHRYKVDIRDLQLLSGTRGIGAIPDDFRVSGTSMSIMSFISQVCDVGAADFFIELQEDSPIAEYDIVGNLLATHSSPFSGVIKVRVIPRNRPVALGKIRTVIDAATRHPNVTTGLSTSTGPWADRVVSSSLGYEFADPEVGTMMIGAPRTRVIGVTPLGQANLRPEYGSGTDTLIEDYPDGEFDGVWLGLGNDYPTDFSTYERAQQMDPPRPETEDTRNDAYLNWFWSKNKKDELHIAVTGQDGMIDMYPCWGFHTATPVGASHGAIVTVESKGMPILGKFHDDNPYRDFDEKKGIFSHNKDDGVIEWVKGGTPEPKNPTDPAGTPPDPQCTKAGGSLGRYNRFCHASRSSSVPNKIFNIPRFRTQSSAGGSGSATCVLSSGFRSPASATIPIDLGGAGYSGGPTGTNGDFSNFYYATVTELRHVIKGKESWLRYMKEYQPFLPCHMGWNQYCPVADIANAQSGAAIKGVSGFDTGNNVPEDAASSRQKGKKADGRQSANTSPAGMEVSDARTKALAAMIADQQDRAFRKISDIANNYYGKKYLVPLPYNGKFDVYGDLDNWIRRIDPNSMQFELRWDLSNSGWAGEIDTTNAEVNKRYPHNINFYDEDGKLNAFMAFPTQEKMRCSHEMAYLDFGSVDPDAVHSTPLSNNSMGGGSKGKTYVKATVDTKTYWILDQSAVDIHHNNVSEASIRPFALITISSPVHWSKDDSIKIGTNQRPPGGGSATDKNMMIPLGGFADGRVIDNCNVSAAIAGIYGQEIGGTDLAKANAGPTSGTGQTKMAPARYKPWACGVPQTSNRFTWGPWAAGVNFGKANFVDDSSYSPEAFGSVALMNLAARGKVITLNDPNVFVESGNVTVTGVPDYAYGIGSQIFGDGPTVSDISVDIGPGGITTTYTMQTQQKFGEIQGIYEDRIKKLQSDAMENSKKMAASLKKTKLISFRDLSSKFNK